VIEYVFALSGFLAIISMVRGPTFADRALAGSVFTNITLIVLLIFAVRTQIPLYLDISVVLIFISFVGTLAIAKYVRRQDV
jgi:multicomponent Na+:H+ antiporter subunit F